MRDSFAIVDPTPQAVLSDGIMGVFWCCQGVSAASVSFAVVATTEDALRIVVSLRVGSQPYPGVYRSAGPASDPVSRR